MSKHLGQDILLNVLPEASELEETSLSDKPGCSEGISSMSL